MQLIYIAENGQMAIHLPLTQARIGAFSTHTAHVQNLAEQSGQLESIGPFLDTAKPRAHDFWR
jgi:hypothetical protein